jgi:uncharacterized protein YuzE
MMNRIQLEVDLTANAGYIRLSEEEVHRTVQVTEDVLIDIDKMGIVVGIEALKLSAEIPFGRLVEDYHLHTDVVEEVRRIQPSISGVLDLTLRSEGTTGSVSVSQKAVPA